GARRRRGRDHRPRRAHRPAARPDRHRHAGAAGRGRRHRTRRGGLPPPGVGPAPAPVPPARRRPGQRPAALTMTLVYFDSSALAVADPDLVVAVWNRRLHAGAAAASLHLAPASLAPASLAPASLAPASLAPASLAPASLAPASLETGADHVG